jgi:hypothetical protein
MTTVAEAIADSPTPYQLVDRIPGVAEERAAVRAGAVAIMEARRSGDDVGGIATAELLPVDALSTAYHVLAAEERRGFESPERAELWGGLVQDCRRLYAEWYRKLKPVYFPPVRHTFDPATQTFYSHGLSVAQMTLNGLVPMPDKPEEERCRVHEKVEDETPRIVLQTLGAAALEGAAIRTFSECPDWAEAAYAADMDNGRRYAGYDGYVPPISKIMARDMKIDTITGDRLEEVVGVPGTLYVPSVLREVLRRQGAEVGDMDKTDLRGAQMLVYDDLMTFFAEADKVAGKEWNTNVFMGEEVPPNFVKDYEKFRQEAIQRQQGQTENAEIIATFVLTLAREGEDRRKAPAKVEEFVKMMLLDESKKDLNVARFAFDDATADSMREVIMLEGRGLYDRAFNRQQQVMKAAPGGGYCGAGSCGLEGVDRNSEEGKQLVADLRAEPGDKIVLDKERSCKCGKKSIAYAYSADRVNKYCKSCHAFESKRSSPTSAAAAK